MRQCIDVSDRIVRRGSSQGLIVLLHGWQHTPDNLQPLVNATAELLPDFDCYAPRLPIRRFLSRARLEELTRPLLSDLDTIVQARSARSDQMRYEQITLVGHSLGAALARSVWALAHGARPDATMDPEASVP